MHSLASYIVQSYAIFAIALFLFRFYYTYIGYVIILRDDSYFSALPLPICIVIIIKNSFIIRPIIVIIAMYMILGLWLRLECSLDSLSIDSAHVIYVAEGHNVGAERQSSVMTLRKPIVTWII